MTPGSGIPPSASRTGDDAGRRSAWRTSSRAFLAVVVFLAAIRLLGEATGAASDELAGILSVLDDRPLSAVGVGWLFTYVLANGSVVAALGVTLTGVGAGDPMLTVALVSGSRLGAAAFVLMVGVLDHSRRGRSLRSGVELGMLAFVVSHALYIPATLLSWASLPSTGPALANVTSRIDPTILQPGIVDTTAERLVTILGPVVVAVVGVAGLFLGVVLFDRALGRVDLDGLRERIPLERPWLSFLAGLIVTGLTSSIAFSIGVLVPFFNRRGITRKEITPYVLGANVTTLLDTFVVSVALRSWDAAGAVLALTLIVLVVSIVFLLAYGTWFRIVDYVLDSVTATRTNFVLFLVTLVAAPILLIVVGGWP